MVGNLGLSEGPSTLDCLSLSKSKIVDYVNAGGNARTEGEMKTALDSGKGSVIIF